MRLLRRAGATGEPAADGGNRPHGDGCEERGQEIQAPGGICSEDGSDERLPAVTQEREERVAGRVGNAQHSQPALTIASKQGADDGCGQY